MEPLELKVLSTEAIAKIRALVPQGESTIARSAVFSEMILKFFQGWAPKKIAEWAKGQGSVISSRALAIYIKTQIPSDLFTEFEVPAPKIVDAIAEMERLYYRQMQRIHDLEKYLKAKGVTTSKWLADEIALARDILVKLQSMRSSTRQMGEETVRRERVMDPDEAGILAQIIAEAYATGQLRKFQPKDIEDATNS